VRIIHHVLNTVNRPHGDSRFLERVNNFPRTVLSTPVGECFVDLLLMNDAAWIMSKFRILRHIQSSGLGHEALKNTVAVAADNDVFLITAEIGVGRNNPGDGASRGFANDTRTIELWDDPFE